MNVKRCGSIIKIKKEKPAYYKTTVFVGGEIIYFLILNTRAMTSKPI